MFLDVINDLLINSSIFYIYFGFLFMTFGISQLLIIQQRFQGIHENYSLDEIKHLDIHVNHFEKPLVSHERFILWFVKSFQRIKKPDDDEDESNPYFYHKLLQIRGGQTWKETIYLHDLKNIGDHSYSSAY